MWGWNDLEKDGIRSNHIHIKIYRMFIPYFTTDLSMPPTGQIIFRVSGQTAHPMPWSNQLHSRTAGLI